MQKSFRKCVRHAASEEGFEVNSFPVRDGKTFSDKPVQLVLAKQLDNGVREEVKAGMKKIAFADLDLKVIDHHDGAGGKQYLLYYTFVLNFHTYILP